MIRLKYDTLSVQMAAHYPSDPDLEEARLVAAPCLVVHAEAKEQWLVLEVVVVTYWSL
jgi:hypothetical protein